MKKTTMILFMICAVLLVAIAGCSKTADKMESVAEKWSDGVSGGGYAEAQGVAVARNTVAMDTTVESKVVLMEDMDYGEPTYAPAPYYDDMYDSYGSEIEVEQKIIKTASMSIEVEDYFLASQKTEAYAKKYGGYISNSNAYKDQNEKTRGTTTIRIPEIHYDAMMAELSLLGTVERKDVSGQDVTEQYVDMSARLNNAEAHEERLVTMYANASDVEEMLNVERELSRVREEIERYEGQLRYMDSKVSYSTITVTLYEKQPVVKEWGIWTAIKQAVENMLTTIQVLIMLIGWLLPLIVIGGIVVVSVLFARRKKRRGRK